MARSKKKGQRAKKAKQVSWSALRFRFSLLAVSHYEVAFSQSLVLKLGGGCRRSKMLRKSRWRRRKPMERVPRGNRPRYGSPGWMRWAKTRSCNSTRQRTTVFILSSSGGRVSGLGFTRFHLILLCNHNSREKLNLKWGSWCVCWIYGFRVSRRTTVSILSSSGGHVSGFIRIWFHLIIRCNDNSREKLNLKWGS